MTRKKLTLVSPNSEQNGGRYTVNRELQNHFLLLPVSVRENSKNSPSETGTTLQFPNSQALTILSIILHLYSTVYSQEIADK